MPEVEDFTRIGGPPKAAATFWLKPLRPYRVYKATASPNQIVWMNISE
jgi:hypothetical protein